jgi:hypothetical protein
VASIYNVATLVLPLFCATAIIIWWTRRENPRTPSGFDLGALSSGLWATILPAGIFFWGPLALLGSLATDEWRRDWRHEWQPRSLVCATIFASLLLAAGLPSPTPTGAEEWGEPLFSENPDSPLWPGSEQHLWALSSPELAVVTVTTTRLPGAVAPLGTAQVSAELVLFLGADEARLHQAIQRMSELTILRSIFNPDDFDLVPIPSEGHHRYFSSARGIDVDLVAVRQHVTYDALIPGSEVLEVLTVYRADWGGVVTTLTVVRPAANSGEVWAEDIVLDWLNSINS